MLLRRQGACRSVITVVKIFDLINGGGVTKASPGLGEGGASLLLCFREFPRNFCQVHNLILESLLTLSAAPADEIKAV